VSWQIYQEWDNFTDNAVEYFVPFKKIGKKILASVDGGYRTTEEFYFALFAKTATEQQTLRAQFDAAVAKLSPAERSLFGKGMYRGEPLSLVSQLRADIKARKLPKVSWLVPSAVDSEHPGASTPAGSANLIYNVLDTIASDHDTWSKTALLINFDENDGYFDHVPPPVPPGSAANDADHFGGQPLGFGPRVPMTLVSPWTIGGYVDSQVYDHTSVLRLLERWTGVAEPNISRWRRTVAGDLTGAFDFSRQGRPPHVTRPGAVPAPISRWHPAAPVVQKLPVAESGSRPARALPYQASVSGVVTDGELVLQLNNSGRASAHFTVYPYAGELSEPAHHDVQGSSPVSLPGDPYQVVVQGPNRAWWELSGNHAGTASGVDVRTRFLPQRCGVEFSFVNSGSQAVTLRLTASRYGRANRVVRVPAGRSATVDWPTSQGWYDIRVTADGDASFLRTLTGRVEDGRTGVSG
jgi:phospholipase C